MAVPSGPLVRAVRRARDLIDREYDARLDLDTLAREAGYSKYHLARGFAAARPYGIEAVFRDDPGNWFSLTQRLSPS
jgi:transcriptional regulator GlxA family with amidase domain